MLRTAATLSLNTFDPDDLAQGNDYMHFNTSNFAAFSGSGVNASNVDLNSTSIEDLQRAIQLLRSHSDIFLLSDMSHGQPISGNAVSYAIDPNGPQVSFTSRG